MDGTVLAGIIGGISTIAAVVITPMIQRYFETKNFFPITRDRRKALVGSWRGTFDQYINETTSKPHTVDLTFEIKGKKIHGTGVISENEIDYLILEGSFRNDRFLKMDYQNKNYNIIQFGSFIFHLSEDSKILSGNFVGYGYLSRSIVYGSCKFKKV